MNSLSLCAWGVFQAYYFSRCSQCRLQNCISSSSFHYCLNIFAAIESKILRSLSWSSSACITITKRSRMRIMIRICAYRLRSTMHASLHPCFLSCTIHHRTWCPRSIWVPWSHRWWAMSPSFRLLTSQGYGNRLNPADSFLYWWLTIWLLKRGRWYYFMYTIYDQQELC